MNSKTNAPGTMSARRVVPAIAIVVLAIGLGACQTPPRGTVVPQQHVVQSVPAGPDTDRFSGMPADRVEEQLARERAATSGAVAQHRPVGLPTPQ